MSTLTVHWGDETMTERTGHPPSYAEAKKTKSLTFHTHCCLMASLRNSSSSSSSSSSIKIIGSIIIDDDDEDDDDDDYTNLGPQHDCVQLLMQVTRMLVSDACESVGLS